jgi:hypothetical protein
MSAQNSPVFIFHQAFSVSWTKYWYICSACLYGAE